MLANLFSLFAKFSVFSLFYRCMIFYAAKVFSLKIAFASLLQCPFGRAIYVFEYKNTPFLRQMQCEITAVNAEALELDTLPQHVIEAALSTYKLSRWDTSLEKKVRTLSLASQREQKQ